MPSAPLEAELTMANPLILILAFGAAAFLGGMLRSLLAQWFPARVGSVVAIALAACDAGMAIRSATVILDPESRNFLMPLVPTRVACALLAWSSLAAKLSALISSEWWRTFAFILCVILASA